MMTTSHPALLGNEQLGICLLPSQAPKELRAQYDRIMQITPELVWRQLHPHDPQLAQWIPHGRALILTGNHLKDLAPNIQQLQPTAMVVIAIGTIGTDGDPIQLVAERHALEDLGATLCVPANTIPHATQRRLRQALQLTTPWPNLIPIPNQPLQTGMAQGPNPPHTQASPTTPVQPIPEQSSQIPSSPQPTATPPAQAAKLPDGAVVLPIGYQAPEQELLTVLWRLAEQRYTGPIRFHHQKQILRSFWQEGQPCWIHSQLESEQWPAFLLRRGRLSKATYQQLPKQPDKLPQQWAKDLVEQGHILADEAEALLQSHLRAQLRQWMTLETGVLHQGEMDPLFETAKSWPMIRLPLAPQAWLLDGMLHTRRMQRYRYYLGDQSALLQPTSRLNACKHAMALSAYHTHLLHRCDGATSIAALIAEAPEREEEILAVLATCCLLGALTSQHAQPAKPLSHATQQNTTFWAWYERAKSTHYFEFLELPLDATQYAIEQAILAHRQQMLQWHDPIAPSIARPWQQMLDILDDASYVLLDGSRRHAYVQALALRHR